jgi:hypothetical protein
VLDYLRRPYWEPHSDLGAESLGTHNRGFPEPSPRGDWRSWRIIQLMPNRSRTCPKREAKNVSCIGINTRPPSERAAKTRSARLADHMSGTRE